MLLCVSISVMNLCGSCGVLERERGSFSWASGPRKYPLLKVEKGGNFCSLGCS